MGTESNRDRILKITKVNIVNRIESKIKALTEQKQELTTDMKRKIISDEMLKNSALFTRSRLDKMEFEIYLVKNFKWDDIYEQLKEELDAKKKEEKRAIAQKEQERQKEIESKEIIRIQKRIVRERKELEKELEKAENRIKKELEKAEKMVKKELEREAKREEREELAHQRRVANSERLEEKRLLRVTYELQGKKYRKPRLNTRKSPSDIKRELIKNINSIIAERLEEERPKKSIHFSNPELMGALAETEAKMKREKEESRVLREEPIDMSLDSWLSAQEQRFDNGKTLKRLI